MRLCALQIFFHGDVAARAVVVDVSVARNEMSILTALQMNQCYQKEQCLFMFLVFALDDRRKVLTGRHVSFEA